MKNAIEYPRMPAAIIFFALGLASFALSCTRAKTPTAEGTGSQPNAKRYRLVGKVVSIDKQSSSVTVDHEDIPGFMGAMTMAFTVKPASRLDSISPGDSITADVVVKDGQGADYWLENLKVTHAP